MAKFKVGDKCRVIKNALAPNCVGHTVEIVNSFQGVETGKTFYRIKEDSGMTGFASEGCLELVKQ